MPEENALQKTHKKLRTYITFLIVGILTTIIAECITIRNPSAYTLGGLIAKPLIRLIIYFIILGLIALIVSIGRSNVRKHWLPIFAWLFLIVGLFDIVVGSFNEFVLRPQLGKGVEEVRRSGKLEDFTTSSELEEFLKNEMLKYTAEVSDVLDPNRFHSQLNGYSVAIPQGWRQVPDEVISKAFGTGFSENELTFDIETVLAVKFQEKGLEHPYAVIQVKKYSQHGVNQPLKKGEIEEIFRMSAQKIRLSLKKTENVEEHLSGSLQKMVSQVEFGRLYLDNENMSYMFGTDVEAANLGKIKTLQLGCFGGYAQIQITFSCLESDWQRLRNDRDLILNSFHFDPAPDYEGAREQKSSFGTDLLVDVAVYGTVGLVIVLIGSLARIFPSKAKKPD